MRLFRVNMEEGTILFIYLKDTKKDPLCPRSLPDTHNGQGEDGNWELNPQCGWQRSNYSSDHHSILRSTLIANRIQELVIKYSDMDCVFLNQHLNY